MSDAKFTPGPWYVAADADEEMHGQATEHGTDIIAPYTPTGSGRRCYTETVCRMVEGYVVSNARLIAASPEMYEALKIIPSHRLRTLAAWIDLKTSDNPDREVQEDLLCLADAQDAALAKAEGGTQ